MSDQQQLSFDEDVKPWTGTIQALYSDEHAQLGDGYGLKYETGPIHPGVLVAFAPWRTAADFLLHPMSPGKGAGASGRDLGADVHGLGPGKAYEQWKKTPAYRRWLAATGQTQHFHFKGNYAVADWFAHSGTTSAETYVEVNQSSGGGRDAFQK